MCKHVAAGLYGVGARPDQSPELLFTLRAVNHEELITQAATATHLAGKTSAASPELAESEIGGSVRHRVGSRGGDTKACANHCDTGQGAEPKRTILGNAAPRPSGRRNCEPENALELTPRRKQPQTQGFLLATGDQSPPTQPTNAGIPEWTAESFPISACLSLMKSPRRSLARLITSVLRLCRKSLPRMRKRAKYMPDGL